MSKNVKLGTTIELLVNQAKIIITWIKPKYISFQYLPQKSNLSEANQTRNQFLTEKAQKKNVYLAMHAQSPRRQALYMRQQIRDFI